MLNFKSILLILKRTFGFRQHYLNRHLIVIVIIGFYVFFALIWKITTIWSDIDLQKQAEKQSLRVYKYNSSRGEIFDRDNKHLASNSFVTRINVDPFALDIVGFNKISSIWRITSKCRDTDLEECKGKNLANRARKLFKNKNKNDKFLVRISPVKTLVKLTNKKYKKVYNRIIQKKKQSKNYFIAAKDLVFGTTLADIKSLQSEKFLICKTYKLKKSNKQKVIDFMLGWIIGVDGRKNKTTCMLRKINGIALELYDKRFYPQAIITTALIGVINKKRQGVFGIEKIFNGFLSSSKNKYQIKKDNASWKNHYKYKKIALKQENNLYLNIDSQIQSVLFRHIKESVDKYQAKSGSGIILKPNGEIVSLVSYPSSNPNIGINDDDNYSHYLNRPMAEIVDTASTIKPFIALMALDKNIININSKIDIRKSEGIRKFRVDKKRPFIQVKNIIKESHGLGSIKIGKLLKDEDIYNSLSLLKFGSPIGILPGIENFGFLRHFDDWSKSDKKRVSFGGYGVINTTIAQIARAYLVFVNQGKIRNLKLFKDTEDISYQVFNKKHINDIIGAMEAGVNQGGTGKKAKLNKYIAAGKTGTAQLLINGKYSNKYHNTLFVGFAPSRNAKYLMVVSINNPKGRYLDGGSVAAPVFKKVMDDILK